ncbi:DUF6471 domain-containing protein [Solirhodobacter olei]|uniref:DUF6471 domain-containing protein n=1 Tax=Solirhodobacter olei TaxID=2493082 RepID=UPI000FDBA704|nr:DUF6471 domain-containing protein [Solirhodobacter olei]
MAPAFRLGCPRTSRGLIAKGLLRAEMARRNVTYAGLVEKLAAVGVEDNERNLRNKVSRGKFTARFFLQCLVALGRTSLRLD